MPPLVRPTRPRQPWRRVASTTWRTRGAAGEAAEPEGEQRREPAGAERRPRPPARRRRSRPATAAAGESVSRLALRHGSTGATAMRNSRASPIGIVMRSKYGSPTESRSPLHRLDDQREHGAEQHDEGERGEQHVVGEERALARERRVDAAGRPQPVAPPADEPDGDEHDEAEEAEQQRPDRRLAERVHRVEHARAGEERAEDGEAERGAQQRQVPDPQHPAPLLHHHRVEVGGAGEPRQERRVLDRVPRPVAAPAEHLVAPPRAEHDADA